MSEHFFSRWSQRKQAVAKGVPVAEAAVPASPVDSSELTGSSQSLQRSTAAPQEIESGATEAKSSELPAKPLPSLDDARALTPTSPATRSSGVSRPRASRPSRIFPVSTCSRTTAPTTGMRRASCR